VPHIGKAKLAKRVMLLDLLPLASIRSFTTTNTYSMVKISKGGFLVGTQIVSDLEIFRGTKGV